MNIAFILLQAQGAAGQPGAGMGGGGLLMIVVLFVLMWLLMIRPQNKKAKEEAKMRSELQKGDRVLFSGGIYGKIHSVDEKTVEVEVTNGVIITVEKSFIQSVIKPE